MTAAKRIPAPTMIKQQQLRLVEVHVCSPFHFYFHFPIFLFCPDFDARANVNGYAVILSEHTMSVQRAYTIRAACMGARVVHRQKPQDEKNRADMLVCW